MRSYDLATQGEIIIRRILECNQHENLEAHHAKCLSGDEYR